MLWLFGSGNISGTSRNGLQVRLSLNSVLVCITDLTEEEEVKRKRQGEGTCRNLISMGISLLGYLSGHDHAILLAGDPAKIMLLFPYNKSFIDQVR